MQPSEQDARVYPWVSTLAGNHANQAIITNIGRENHLMLTLDGISWMYSGCKYCDDDDVIDDVDGPAAADVIVEIPAADDDAIVDVVDVMTS